MKKIMYNRAGYYRNWTHHRRWDSRFGRHRATRTWCTANCFDIGTGSLDSLQHNNFIPYSPSFYPPHSMTRLITGVVKLKK